MTENASPTSSPSTAVELKSGSITLPILKILSPSLEAVTAQLEEKLGKAPEFFRNAPIILDLGDLPEADKDQLDFTALLKTIHRLSLAPVGMRGGSFKQQQAAQDEKLAILAEVRSESPAPEAKPQPRRPLPPPRQPVSVTKVIDQPVRSGQKIYAAGGDLIVMAQVSPGAEIMADGNIHVYGPLKGRALAGVQGNLEARIFCTDLQAQLIAIGGNYRTSEDEDASLKGRLVQIHLKDDALVVTPV
jgi:septum site-determining protein MinC